MSQKACKTLQIIAFAFFAFALLLSIVSIFAQDLIKSIYSAPAELYGYRVIPYQAIAYCLIRTLFALIYLLIVCGHPSRRKTIAITVVMAALFIAFNTVISPVIGTVITAVAGNYGVAALSATTIVNTGVNFITGFFTAPATLLMFLSLGGACGKDFSRKNAEPARAFPQNPPKNFPPAPPQNPQQYPPQYPQK